MSEAIEMLKSMVNGDPTEFGMLPPFDQELARKAQSVGQRAFNEYGNAEVLVARSWLRKAFFDALNRTGEWAVTGWTAQPQLSYPFERVERGSRPMPVLMTVPSTKSSNTVVVMVCFRDVNFQGYGELATADFYTVSEVFPSAQEAEDFQRELTNAIKYWCYKLPALVARNAQRAEATQASAWSDAPDF